ncbi:hypothetical protein OS493_038448 [Desmophyllum pertusum]|uniref:Uncharacterized protein n=1 Tax=Desmophyllum pertusum TaxID=174260 RepID=A0A9W9Z6G1_9CNID|nr:hypothetical protein OS493_038448 [Desmophyllum pertusum]
MMYEELNGLPDFFSTVGKPLVQVKQPSIYVFLFAKGGKTRLRLPRIKKSKRSGTSMTLVINLPDVRLNQLIEMQARKTPSHLKRARSSAPRIPDVELKKTDSYCYFLPPQIHERKNRVYWLGQYWCTTGSARQYLTAAEREVFLTTASESSTVPGQQCRL